MSINIKKIALSEQQCEPEGHIINKNYLGLVANIEVPCSIRIGTLNISIAELKDLKTGQLLHLEQKTNEPIELVFKDRVIAKGELMSFEDNFAIQITEVGC